MVTEIDHPRLNIERYQRLGAVRLERSGQLILTLEVAQKLGRGRVAVLDKGSNRFGLIAATRSPGQPTRALTRLSGGTRCVSARAILAELGRIRPKSVVDLPFVWDGDVLVVNVSALDRSEVDSDGR